VRANGPNAIALRIAVFTKEWMGEPSAQVHSWGKERRQPNPTMQIVCLRRLALQRLEPNNHNPASTVSETENIPLFRLRSQYAPHNP
jgi:hypothetical protein